MTLYHNRRTATIQELPESVNIFSADNPNRVIVGASQRNQDPRKPVRETAMATNMR